MTFFGGKSNTKRTPPRIVFGCISDAEAHCREKYNTATAPHKGYPATSAHRWGKYNTGRPPPHLFGVHFGAPSALAGKIQHGNGTQQGLPGDLGAPAGKIQHGAAPSASFWGPFRSPKRTRGENTTRQPRPTRVTRRLGRTGGENTTRTGPPLASFWAPFRGPKRTAGKNTTRQPHPTRVIRRLGRTGGENTTHGANLWSFSRQSPRNRQQFTFSL